MGPLFSFYTSVLAKLVLSDNTTLLLRCFLFFWDEVFSGGEGFPVHAQKLNPLSLLHFPPNSIYHVDTGYCRFEMQSLYVEKGVEKKKDEFGAPQPKNSRDACKARKPPTKPQLVLSQAGSGLGLEEFTRNTGNKRHKNKWFHYHLATSFFFCCEGVSEIPRLWVPDEHGSTGNSRTSMLLSNWSNCWIYTNIKSWLLYPNFQRPPSMFTNFAKDSLQISDIRLENGQISYEFVAFSAIVERESFGRSAVFWILPVIPW